jgi:hypothetical protein
MNQQVEVRKVTVEKINLATHRVVRRVIWVVEVDGAEVGCGMTKAEAENIAGDYRS